MKHAGGRPLAYQSAEELSNDIEAYFTNEDQPTLAGLAYELGISRQTLYNYDNKEQFFDIVKRAREKVESIYEKRLLYSTTPTGVIFALKNMSWRDKTETDITSGGEPIPLLGGATNGVQSNNSNGETPKADQEN